MRSSLEQVLDTCVAQLNSGEDLEEVLAAYPEDADELRPMLVAAALVCVDVPPPVHKMTRKAAFLDAVSDRRRQVEITEGYVVEMKAGVPITELLSRATPALQPVIGAAWRMFTTTAPQPTPEKMAAGKARLMAMAQQRRAARRAAAPGSLARARRAWLGLLIGLKPRPTVTRRAWSGVVALLLVSITLTMGAAGVGTVAASSLPGDSLYEVKEFGRSAMMAFAFDPTERIELQLRFGSERLAEMDALAKKGRMVPADALESWLQGQSLAVSYIQRLPEEQRRELYELLLTSVDREDLESSLRRAIDDPQALDDLLARSDTLMRQAQASVGSEPVTPEAQAMESYVEPVMPVPDNKANTGGDRRRESSDDAVDNEPRAPQPDEPEVVAPASVEAPSAPKPPEPQYVQVGDDDEDRRRPSSGVAGGPDEPASATVTQPEPTATATDPPPAYNQPIYEDPTETPEPPAEEPTAMAPQGQEPGEEPGGDPGEEPGDEPPATPMPGETPATEP